MRITSCYWVDRITVLVVSLQRPLMFVIDANEHFRRLSFFLIQSASCLQSTHIYSTGFLIESYGRKGTIHTIWKWTLYSRLTVCHHHSWYGHLHHQPEQQISIFTLFKSHKFIFIEWMKIQAKLMLFKEPLSTRIWMENPLALSLWSRTLESVSKHAIFDL